MKARSLLLGLAAVAALTSGLTSGAAAQTILPPASSADTAVRANVGINVANFATQAQLSGYATQGQLSSLDNRVIITQNHVTNLGDQVNTASQFGRPWPRALPNQWRTSSQTDPSGYASGGGASIDANGLVSLYAEVYGRGWVLLSSRYTGGTASIFWSYNELFSAAINAGVYWGNPWIHASVYPISWDSNGNATDWRVSVALMGNFDLGSNGGGDF
jgi:hypothetical protein